MALVLLLWPPTVTVMVAMVRRLGLVLRARVCKQPLALASSYKRCERMAVALLFFALGLHMRAGKDQSEPSSRGS